MPGRKVHRLTALQVSRGLPPGLYPDGAGLYLQVSPGGSKSWLYRFMLHERPRMMGLGSLLTTSLAEAREKSAKARKLRADGVDPIVQKRASRAAARAATAKDGTFAECVESYVRAHQSGWRSIKYAAQWQKALSDHVLPVIGALPVASVDTPLVLCVLEPLWSTRTVTASRVRGRIEAVLDWARVRGYRDGENPARWRGHLDKLLPRPTWVKKKKHFAALPYRSIPAFMAELRKREDAGARALEFLILTAARSGEVRGATGTEFDTASAMWTIPGSRMKGNREHRVPLPAPALDLVDAACSHIGVNAMGRVLTTLRPGLTVHGFRSTFRDWAAETTSYPNHVVEMALAHSIGSAVEAAYRRGDMLDKRRALMEEWATFCGRENAMKN
jgi:integrase